MAANPQAPSVEGTIPFTVDGETHYTWYRVFGDVSDRSHTPLVGLHGGPGLAHDYLLPLSDLTVKASTPVILYDQIGGGRSMHLRDKPQSFWTIELFIDELVNVLTFFGIKDNFDLLGHSWGGMLAMEFEVRRHPEGLRHLVITDSMASNAVWHESMIQLLEAFPEDVQEGVKAGWTDVKKLAPALKQFFAKHGCTAIPPPVEFWGVMKDVLKEDGDPTVEIAMWTGDLKEWSIIDRAGLVRSSVRTLLINGRNDVSQDLTIYPLFKNIPSIKWRTFENSSHTPMLEEREAFVEAVEAFLLL